MKNKKAQTMGMAIVFSITFFIIAMTSLNFIKDEVTTARVNMNCAAPTEISDGTKLTCLGIDLVVSYWILLILSIVLGTLTARLFL